jgi:hypothetical protein
MSTAMDPATIMGIEVNPKRTATCPRASRANCVQVRVQGLKRLQSTIYSPLLVTLFKRIHVS